MDRCAMEGPFPSSFSTYGSIVYDLGDPWEKLDEAHELVQLHRKFWNEAESDLLGRYEDKGAEEGEDDETGPGCHVLDIGIPALGCTKLWIRKEYIRVYNRCNDYLETNRNGQLPPSMVITGSPGIGKSYWIFYAMCRRLAERKPIMWYRGGRLFLFVEDGVYLAPSDYPFTELKTRVWTLIDADDADKGEYDSEDAAPPDSRRVPPNLATQDTKNLVIYTTPLQWRRWEGLGKTTRHVTTVMNPWTREEISRAALEGFSASIRESSQGEDVDEEEE